MMSLREHFRRQKFDPTLLGVWVNPFFLARRALRQQVSAFSSECEAPVLDVGCGSRPYRELFAGEYVGVEVDTPLMRERGHADIYYDGRNLPFEDARFSTVLCNQVLEHVFEPDKFLAELARVLRPGGKLLLTVPFVWDEHEQPYDFCRYSSFGLRAVLERNGFAVVRLEKTLSDVGVIGQLVNAYLYKLLWGRNRVLDGLAMVVVFAPITVVFSTLRLFLPRNEDLFLDNVVLAERRPS